MLLAIGGRISRTTFRNVGHPKLTEVPEARAKSTQLSFMYRKHTDQRLFKFPILHSADPEGWRLIPSFVFERQLWCLRDGSCFRLLFSGGVLFSTCSRPV